MKLAIYIPDITYGQEEDDTDGRSELFGQELETEYGRKFKYVDIGPGASWPAFLTYLSIAPGLALALGIFFAGSPIEKNLEAWSKIGKRIKKLFKRRPVLDRHAAAVIAAERVIEEMGGLPKSIILRGYKITYSYDMIEAKDFDEVVLSEIEPTKSGYWRGDRINWFDIEADGVCSGFR